MTNEHTYNWPELGSVTELADFISAHYPDDTVGWTLDTAEDGTTLVRCTTGDRFTVRPGQRVRWSKTDWPEGRFEVRPALEP